MRIGGCKMRRLIEIIRIHNEAIQINCMDKPLAHSAVIKANPFTMREVNWKLRYLRRPDSRRSELICKNTR